MADILVQRGQNAVDAAGTTQAITAVSSTDSAFVNVTNSRGFNAGPTGSASNMEPDDLAGAVQLTATDTLTFTRESTGIASCRFDWEVWEYTGSPGGANEFIVRDRRIVSLNSGTNGTTATLSSTPTDIDKCIPIITGLLCDGTADDMDNMSAIAWISGSDTLNVLRGGDANDVQVAIVTVEFTGSNWEVYHGRQEDPADTGTITLVDNADGTTAGGGDVTDWSTAVIFGQLKGNNRNGVDDAISDMTCIFEPGSSTTTVDWAHHANHDDSASSPDQSQRMVHVLRHPDLAVTRFTDTQNTQGAMNVDITSAGLSDLTQSGVVVFRNSSGGGTAFGRGICNARLTSLTNCELWAHRSGNAIATRVQVVDFSGVEVLVPATSLEQEGFRFRNDDGSESAASWAAAQDTGITAAAGSARRLRMLTDNSGQGVSNQTVTLQYKRDDEASSEWRDV
jgi:hypothetical protein